ncbi:MAG TPA: hypothetical protein VJ904_02345 [Tichowtungia sp.]|nr:hypothetical protein [Tichowtungia sp.]
MKAEDYHKSLAPLEEACRIAGWTCLTCPLTGGRLLILFRHVSLVFKTYKIRQRRMVVREFSTLPLLLVFPLLWPLRKKLYFLINHNLQWAARDPLERFGLAILARLGARWALFESRLSLRPQVSDRFGLSSEKTMVLPHPVLQSPPVEGCPKGGEGASVVGVAGYYRPEKGIDELVGLLKETCPEFEILLGLPNPEAAAHLDVETVSTASETDYFNMIARCDVLVFNGEKDSYFYRASGPVADAAACRTAVVAPDFPVLGKQVAGIGEVFQTLETGPAGCSLPDAVRTAVEKVRAAQYDFDAYCGARSPQALAEKLRTFTQPGS